MDVTYMLDQGHFFNHIVPDQDTTLKAIQLNSFVHMWGKLS